jgi:hypothetical protein
MFFILGRFTGFRPAIGMVGLTSHDLAALGPLSARVEQIDLHSRVGFSHTSVPQALGFSDIAERIARYTSFSGAQGDDPIRPPASPKRVGQNNRRPDTMIGRKVDVERSWGF